MAFITAWCIEHAIPTVVALCTLIIECCIENITRILFIITAFYAFIDANTRLVEYYSISSDEPNVLWRQRLPTILRTLLPITLWLFSLHFFLYKEHLHRPLTWRLPNISLNSACNTLWAAFAADTTTKFSAMIINCMVDL